MLTQTIRLLIHLDNKAAETALHTCEGHRHKNNTQVIMTIGHALVDL